MENDIAEIVLTAAELRARVAELGQQITRDYQGQDLMLVGVLKGALIFMVDLARAIDLPLSMDFMAISSYGASTETTGVVRILKDLDASIEGKHVLIVEDIVDTGLTLKYITELLAARHPASLRVCALLNKVKPRKAAITLDYMGFEIPDRFVVGYGLDFTETYRNLPFVGLLRPDKQPQ